MDLKEIVRITGVNMAKGPKKNHSNYMSKYGQGTQKNRLDD